MGWAAPGALLGVVLALAVGTDASAAAAPDAAELSSLQASLSSARTVRVTGTFGTRVLRDIRLDAHGVSSARWGPGTVLRPALIVGEGVVPAPPPPVAWDQISKIEVGQALTAKGAGTGMVLGALVGAGVWWILPLGPDGDRGPAIVLIGVPAAAGTLLGGLLGSHSYGWRAVHPPEIASTR